MILDKLAHIRSVLELYQHMDDGVATMLNGFRGAAISKNSPAREALLTLEEIERGIQ